MARLNHALDARHHDFIPMKSISMNHSLRLQNMLVFMLACGLMTGAALAKQDLAKLDFHWLHEKQAAMRLFADEKYEASIKALREAAANAPDDANRSELLATAAIAQAHLGQNEEALARARALENKAYSGYAVLRIFSIQKDNQAILAAFADVSIGDWPVALRAPGFQLRGKAYEARDKPKEAIADYQASITAAGDHTQQSLPVMMDLAHLHRSLDQDEEAKTIYRRVVEMFGQPPQRLPGGHAVYPSAIAALADMLAGENKYEQAVESIERYPADWSTSRSFDMLTRRGDLYLAWGKREKALAAYRDAMAFTQKHASHRRADHFKALLEEKIKSLETR